MQEISLHAMRFHALVGILPHERTVPQPIEIDLTVRVVPGEAIVDYRALYQLAADVMGADPIDFLEEIGERIATSALAYNTRIQAVRVAVRKPNVALPGPLAFAQVVVEKVANA